MFAQGGVKEDEALEVDFRNADRVREANEAGELVDSFAEAGKPERHSGFWRVEFALYTGEVLDVGDYLVEKILSANHLKDLSFGCIERDAKLVQASFDQSTTIDFGEQSPIRVEEDVDISVLKMLDTLCEILDQHRFADAVKNDTSNIRILPDERGKELPRHVGFGFELFIGPGTSRAEEITAVRGFEVKADRFVRSDGVQLRLGLL